nr:tetratricopeptide repeat protein [uncultured Undibacterium sp.]
MRSLILLIALTLLSACSTQKAAIAAKDIPWNDQFFKDEKAVQIVSRDEIFELDKEFKQTLLKPQIQNLSAYERIKYFLDLVYTKETSPFVYNVNETTTASKTWADKRGNCISLTILAYAIGRTLNLPIVMQDVDVPVQFDRRGNLEYLNAHVNAVILHKDFWFDRESDNRGYLIIDFEPQTMVLNKGRVLNENQIVSRFYNNLGAEYLAKKDQKKAYAYYQAAIMASPDNAPAYSNLAQLYLLTGDLHRAETVLRQALALSNDAADAIAMRSLQSLLLSQHRYEEAETFNKAIHASNEKNPHYWIGLGMYAMRQNDYRKAITSLEKAQGLASGFGEIHQNLAEAYLKTGNPDRAREEIRKFVNLLPEHPKSALFRTKFAVR